MTSPMSVSPLIGYTPVMHDVAIGYADRTGFPKAPGGPTGIGYPLMGSEGNLVASAPVPKPGNVGNGTVGAISLDQTIAVTEAWTLTATSATNFTVVGSVSGAKAAATVGTPYTGAALHFTITAGGTAFVAGDAFAITILATRSAEAEAESADAPKTKTKAKADYTPKFPEDDGDDEEDNGNGKRKKHK